MKNNYRFEGDVCYIELKRRDGTILETMIDKEDFEVVNSISGRWRSIYDDSTKSFYVRGHNKTKDNEFDPLLHRFIFNLTDSKIHVDHIHHNTLDNRKSELRIVSNSENHFNPKIIPKGCSFNKNANKWKASIRVNKVGIHLGYFNTEEEARNAYLEAKEKYHIIGG